MRCSRATSPAISFPGDDPDTRLLKTFLVFGLGFVVRPLGRGAHRQLRRSRGPQSRTHPDHTVDGGRHRHHRVLARPTHPSASARRSCCCSAGCCRVSPPAARSAAPPPICWRARTLEQRGRVASWLEASMGMANILGALAAFSVTAAAEHRPGAGLGLADPFHLRTRDRTGRSVLAPHSG